MNPVTWFSIPSSEIDATGSFYANAFGWDIQAETTEPNSDFNYLIALNSAGEITEPDERGRINGCIVKRKTGIEHPVILIEVDDLDDAAAKIQAAGGTIASKTIPMESLNGSFFLARDPEGNLMEVFKPNRS